MLTGGAQHLECRQPEPVRLVLDHDPAQVERGGDLRQIPERRRRVIRQGPVEGLARNPRITMHFTPTSGSWLNLLEIFFGPVRGRIAPR
jgi:hypothetical protein